FINTADLKFGPITVIRRPGQPIKKIPWTAFQLSEADWERVRLCCDILADANRLHQLCSSTRVPTLHQVIPALETLASRWEAKAANPDYALFHVALNKGLEKINKYYEKLDDARSYVLSHFTDPYLKLDYIQQHWGGADDYDEAIANGDPYARNWQAYAREIVDDTMREYWPKRLFKSDGSLANGDAAQAPVPSAPGDESIDVLDEYDRLRLKRLRGADTVDGWKSELQRYLDDPAADVKRDTDLVKWWAVSLVVVSVCASADKVRHTHCIGTCLDVPHCRPDCPRHPSCPCRSRRR
ncbi:hypothetical protein OH76DRAFT_1350567, partial [Lentinus brumalis]